MTLMAIQNMTAHSSRSLKKSVKFQDFFMGKDVVYFSHYVIFSKYAAI